MSREAQTHVPARSVNFSHSRLVSPRKYLISRVCAKRSSVYQFTLLSLIFQPLRASRESTFPSQVRATTLFALQSTLPTDSSHPAVSFPSVNPLCRRQPANTYVDFPAVRTFIKPLLYRTILLCTAILKFFVSRTMPPRKTSSFILRLSISKSVIHVPGRNCLRPIESFKNARCTLSVPRTAIFRKVYICAISVALSAGPFRSMSADSQGNSGKLLLCPDSALAIICS